MGFSSGTKILLSCVFTVPGLIVATAPPALACSCLDMTNDEAVKRADVVFSGKVIAYQKPIKASPSMGIDLITWTFEVHNAFKGKVAKQQKVISPVDEGVCGVRLKVGERYKVYAKRRNNSLETNLCSGTQQLADSATSTPSSTPQLRSSEGRPTCTELNPARTRG